MLTLPNGIKKVEASDNAIVDNFNLNAETLDAHIGSTRKTSADISLYVRTDGSDLNVGDINTAGGALKTIQAAINKIPQTINHSVVINVMAGMYNETVTIAGFMGGRPSITLSGAATLADTHIVSAINLQNNHIPIVISGFNVTIGVSSSSSEYSHVVNCKITTPGVGTGIAFIAANGKIEGCEVSNKADAIFANLLSRVYSVNNTGNSNTRGLNTDQASFIGKSGTQPLGTTSEIIGAGCQII